MAASLPRVPAFAVCVNHIGPEFTDLLNQSPDDQEIVAWAHSSAKAIDAVRRHVSGLSEQIVGLIW